MAYSNYSGIKFGKSSTSKSIEMASRASGVYCIKCGTELYLKSGRKGYFLGCGSFPCCTYTQAV